MTKQQLSETGRRIGTGALQAIAMVIVLRLADAAFDAASDWMRARRAERAAA